MGLPRILRRRWFLTLTVVGVIAVLGVVIALSRPPDRTTPATVPPPASASPTLVAAQQVDKNWLLVDYQVGDDGTGFFTGRITVTNQAGTKRAGLFELAISVNGRQVGNLVGQAAAVDAGATVTVELPVGGHFVPGPYNVVFREAFA